MLEQFAFEFINIDEGTLGTIGGGIFLLGFIAAMIFQSRRKEGLQRAPYFAFSALLFAVGSAIPFLWLASLKAISLNILWALVGAIFLSVSVIGYYCGKFALARSRDAFGHGRYVVFVFIPIANLVLLLKESKNDPSINRTPTIPLLSGGLGVLSGFVMLVIGAALSTFFQGQSEKMMADAQNDPNVQAKMLELTIRSKGIEGAIQEMASGQQMPIMVDDVTNLVSIEAVGNRLRRTYVISRAGLMFTDQLRAHLQDVICSTAFFVSLVRAGASVEEIYVNTDGSLIGSLVITNESCLQ